MKNSITVILNDNLNKNKSGFLNKNNNKKNIKTLSKAFNLNIIKNIYGQKVKLSLYKKNKKIKNFNVNFNK